VAVKLREKQEMVEALKAVAQKCVSAAVAEYRGLTVSQMTDLRSKARKANVYMRVYRNTIARRAFEDTEFSCLTEVLTGPLVLFLSQDEPGAAAKILRDFTKTNEKMRVRGMALGAKLYAPEQLDAIASLPSRTEALTRLVCVMKAPVVQFVRTVKEPVAQMVRVVAAVRDQK
jgi:large subunit ribosomal protein L10